MNLSTVASRRNFWLSVWNGALMIGTTNSIASPELVLTAFAAYLTESPLLLGVIAPLASATWSLPQFWTVSLVQRSPRSLPLYNAAAYVRTVLWMVLIAATFLTRDAMLLLAALLLFVVAGGIAGGVAGLPFIEVIGKVIPPRQRGLVFGWRGAIGGALAVVGAQVVLVLTGPGAYFDYPINFALLFAFGCLAQMVGFFLFSLVKEPVSDCTVRHARPSVKLFRSIWHDDYNFRHYTRGRTLFELSSMANGLIIVYANLVLGVRLELVGLYLLISSVLRPLFSIYAGRLSVRLGNRLPVAAGLIAQALGWALLLLAQPLGVEGRAAEYYLIPIYSLTAIQKGLIFSNLMALGLNVTPENERALYLGSLNTLVGIVALATAGSGLIVATIGYEALFILTGLLACLGAWQFATLHEDLGERS